MNLRIRVKSISKLKDIFSFENFSTTANTIEELICDMVATNVTKFNSSKNAELFLMSKESIDNLESLGKISFGGKKDNQRKVDTRIMQDEAIFQFKNKRFKIINETQKKEYTSLDECLDLVENDCLVFIKLAMLEGRWF
ncbi:MAG: hypothetical protein LBU04_08100 [Christensenellaceae bacterium]|jgi:hypothetical protein|nr:hypothetical protein [Christensenellaceae bacterium]